MTKVEEYMLGIISQLDSDEYQQQGCSQPLVEGEFFTVEEIERLKAGEIIPNWDSGCKDTTCQCHKSTHKTLFWVEASKDADGDWFGSFFSTYERFSVNP